MTTKQGSTKKRSSDIDRRVKELQDALRRVREAAIASKNYEIKLIVDAALQ